MLSFFDSLYSFLSGIVGIFQSVVSLVQLAISSFVSVFSNIVKSITWLTTVMLHMPAIIITFGLGMIAMSIYFFVINR